MLYLTNSVEIKDVEIITRIKNSSKNKYTQHYVFLLDNVEIAFVSLDIYIEYKYLVLYELFVPKKMRKRGYGTMTLSEIEKFARELCLSKIQLNAFPLTADISQEFLFSWYESHGYRRINEGDNQFEFLLC